VALWQWHLHLAAIDSTKDSRPSRFFEEEEEKAKIAHPLRLLPDDVSSAAYETCRAFDLPLEQLAAQIRAAARFAGPIRFESRAEVDAFIEHWACSHAQLLGGLVELTGSWQRPLVDEMARAFFLLGRLVELPADLARDRLYIPLEEMEQAGVAVVQLKAGEATESVRRLLWKQAVRTRDAFAHGQALAFEVSGWQRRAFKKWWLAGLEVLNEIEKHDYDLWAKPIQLSALQRFRVRLQALVGRSTFRRR
jgi:phytoene synthase